MMDIIVVEIDSFVVDEDLVAIIKDYLQESAFVIPRCNNSNEENETLEC